MGLFTKSSYYILVLVTAPLWIPVHAFFVLWECFKTLKDIEGEK